MLWLGVCSSDLRIDNSRRPLWGIWLLTATMAAAGTAVAAVAAAWAAALVATATTWFAAVAATAAWFAAVAATIVAATVVAAVTATAFLGPFSLSYRLTSIGLRHYWCNSQDTRVIWHLRCYSWVSCIWTRVAFAITSPRDVCLNTATFCIFLLLAFAILWPAILYRCAWRVTVTFSFVSQTLFCVSLRAITLSVDILFLFCWNFTSAFIGIGLFPFV